VLSCAALLIGTLVVAPMNLSSRNLDAGYRLATVRLVSVSDSIPEPVKLTVLGFALLGIGSVARRRFPNSSQ